LGSAVFSIPFTAHNAAFQAYYSRGDAVIIQQPFEQLNIKETIDTYGASFTVPLLDRLTDRISIFAGLESDRAYTQLLSTGFSFSSGAQNGRSDVTEVLGGLDWLVHGASSVTDLRLTYRRGIDALGATIYNPATATPFANGNLNSNPTGADGRFGLEQLQFIHILRLNGFSLFSHLNDRAQIILRASGQLTQQPLLSVAKFTVGGVDTVRGFPANSFVRDNGAAGTLELQLPIPGYRPEPSVLNLVVAPFIDYGRSWDKVNANPGDPQNDTSVARYMASAGLGLLWNPFRGVDLQMYWGRGIANNFVLYDPRNYIPHDAQYHGVYFSVNYAVKW
jgi:hemolysin activation/secretion protein